MRIGTAFLITNFNQVLMVDSSWSTVALGVLGDPALDMSWLTNGHIVLWPQQAHSNLVLECE